MDTEDLHLVEMLANLAEANEEEKIVDNDSVLGSQYSTYSNQIKEDNEDDDVEDLNITSLDLDSLSSWNSVFEGPSQSSVSEMENKNAEGNKEAAGTVENNTEDALLNFPQYDGSTDLLLNNEKELSRKSDTTEISKDKSPRKELLNKIITSSRLNFTNIQKRSDFLQKVIGFEFNLNEGIKRKICEILYERYSSRFIAFNAELFSNNAHNCMVNVKLRQNQTREFKSKRRKATQAFKPNSRCPRSKNMLDICKFDHQDLDVYDLEGIELVLSSGDYTNLKHIVNESCSNRISCGDSRSVDLKVPALDGNTIDSSSDSELDQDLTIDRQEKRICVYKSCRKSKKSEDNVVNASLKKRRLELDDPELESPHKRRNTNSLQDESHYTPTKSRTVRSPRSLSGKYTPLDVRVLSPKTDRNGSSGNDPGSSKTYSASTCTTPRRASRQLRMNLLREKVSGLSPDVKQGK